MNPKIDENTCKMKSERVVEKTTPKKIRKNTKMIPKVSPKKVGKQTCFRKKNKPKMEHGTQLGPKMVPRGSQDALNLDFKRFLIHF